MKKFIFLLSFVFVGLTTITAQVTIGSTLAPPKAAILNMQTQADSDPANGGVTSTTGGLLLSRVTLVNLSNLRPFISNGGTNAEKAAHKGLTVYHIGGNNIDPGQYVWDGTQWLLLLTEIPSVGIKTNDRLPLANTVETENLTQYGGSAWTNFNRGYGANLDFGIYNPVSGNYEIRIEADGAYAFSFKMVADAIIPINYLSAHVCTYIAIFKNGVMAECMEHQQDIVRQNTSVTSAMSRTYTINSVLSINCNAGDIITFKTGSHNPSEFWVISKFRAGGQVIAPAGGFLTYWRL